MPPLQVQVLPYTGQHHEDIDRPDSWSTLMWRNNLTALSQRRNLLFAAIMGVVEIFEPEFPNQNFSKRNPCCIDIPCSPEAGPGYICKEIPHAATHLMVRQLGNEEIILLVCDNGDIMAYHVEAIYARLQGCKPHVAERKLVVLPFFHENLGASAWGIDVHSAERMIAASCNTRRITIFAFSICKGDDSSGPESNFPLARDLIKAPLSESWRFPKDGDWLKSRHLANFAFEFELQHHIPGLSFFNPIILRQENEPIILAANAIQYGGGVFDVRQRTKLLSLACSKASALNLNGWGVLCLDPARSRETFDADSTYGCSTRIIGQTVVNTMCVKREGMAQLEQVLFESNLETDMKAKTSFDSVPLPCNILLTDSLDIWLHRFPALGGSSSPQTSTCCRGPLLRAGTHERFEFQHEPLSMIQEIPELGLLVVAQRHALVSVLSTTYWAERGEYGFLVHAVLPSTSVRQTFCRHSPALIGIAVSPVQGHPDPSHDPSSMRVRLILMYSDLCTLAYELSRQSPADRVLIV